jgi:hypothetical protein
MTVKRDLEELLTVDLQTAAISVNEVLNKNPSYKNPRVSSNGTVYEVTIRPNPFLLGTTMKISLERRDSTTKIKVSTKSQWWILGDAFGFYDRYIIDFLDLVRARAALPIKEESSG